MSKRLPTLTAMGAAGISRRRFLVNGAAAGAALGLGVLRVPRAAAEDGVFAHSVASGDPKPDSVIIWTRVTPTRQAVPGSGLGDATQVGWEIAGDPDFSSPVQSGQLTTDASRDHTVKVNVTGLAPATTHYYRFTVLDGPAKGAQSRTGRTRTAPAEGANPEHIRFGVCSCANYEAGYFLGYRAMAERDDLEFVLHLGDFTYEYESGGYVGVFSTKVRTVQPLNREVSLEDFRIRQGHYHGDPDLADMLASKPIIAIWDDHEVADNYAGNNPGTSAETGDDFAAIKAAGNQAYFEWLPVRAGPGFGNSEQPNLYRDLRYGNLLELIIPDLRSFRDAELLDTGTNTWQQSNLDPRAPVDPTRSMLGQNQFEWFAETLKTSSTQWQIIANEVIFAPFTLPAGLDPRMHDWLVKQLGLPNDGFALNTDQWDGYMAERQKIIDLLLEQGMNNVVFLTGDIHSSWAGDVPVDAAAYLYGTDKRAVATEFVTPSISANSGYDSIAASRSVAGPVADLIQVGTQLVKAIDPWFKYIEFTHHGYLAVDVNGQRTQADWFYSDDVLTQDQPLYHAVSYQALNGTPGAVPADGELDQSQKVY